MISRFEQFSFCISTIYRHIQMIERMEMEKYGLKGVFAQYLVVMHRYPGGITATQLCDVCAMDKAAVSRAINEMESKGLILRTGASYRTKVKLTEEGIQAAEFVLDRAARAVELVGLKDEDRTELYDALEHVSRIVQKISKEGIPEA